jgi:putative ABC transport system substrate-binding protein
MASHIGRRKFLATLGGAAGAWPLAARAQPVAKLPTIGFLGSATSATQGQWVAAFVQHLRELGWIEGRTVAIEFRWAEGRTERYAEIAAEFVRLNVDIIVTVGTPPVVAAKQATSIIPIVFASVGEPVGSGLIKTLARPGGNVTGLSPLGTDLAAKRLELLREVLGDLQVGVLGNADNPSSVADMVEIQAAPSAWRLRQYKSGDLTTSRRPSMRSKVVRMHFMSCPIHLLTPTGFASISWRLARDGRRCTPFESTSRREV